MRIECNCVQCWTGWDYSRVIPCAKHLFMSCNYLSVWFITHTNDSPYQQKAVRHNRQAIGRCPNHLAHADCSRLSTGQGDSTPYYTEPGHQLQDVPIP